MQNDVGEPSDASLQEARPVGASELAIDTTLDDLAERGW